MADSWTKHLTGGYRSWCCQLETFVLVVGILQTIFYTLGGEESSRIFFTFGDEASSSLPSTLLEVRNPPKDLLHSLVRHLQVHLLHSWRWWLGHKGSSKRCNFYTLGDEASSGLSLYNLCDQRSSKWSFTLFRVRVPPVHLLHTWRWGLGSKESSNSGIFYTLGGQGSSRTSPTLFEKRSSISF